MGYRGFTLVELLVVIVVLCLLIGLFLSVLEKARERSRALQCSTNLHHLTMCLKMYETDHNAYPYAFDSLTHGMKPPPTGYAGKPTYDRMGWWWFDCLSNSIEKQISEQPIYRCPSRIIGDRGVKENILWGNYGVNRSVCKSLTGKLEHEEFIGSSLAMDQISQPSRTLLVFDCGYSMATWRHVTDEPPQPFGKAIEDNAYIPGLWINKKRTFRSFQEYDALVGRHFDKSINAGFTDGHIERLKADKLCVKKCEDNKYRNLCPLWRPQKSINN
ncbi:MAG: hypothetical protein AMJ78_04220 [Omnitrophica WOR_2 bacterium SM23_29]|nr:MAG: hypothetical protein AMJ78_04220 [Omnitrophica WOR_2 bacterium SM23_29]